MSKSYYYSVIFNSNWRTLQTAINYYSGILEGEQKAKIYLSNLKKEIKEEYLKTDVYSRNHFLHCLYRDTLSEVEYPNLKGNKYLKSYITFVNSFVKKEGLNKKRTKEIIKETKTILQR